MFKLLYQMLNKCLLSQMLNKSYLSQMLYIRQRENGNCRDYQTNKMYKSVSMLVDFMGVIALKCLWHLVWFFVFLCLLLWFEKGYQNDQQDKINKLISITEIVNWLLTKVVALEWLFLYIFGVIFKTIMDTRVGKGKL